MKEITFKPTKPINKIRVLIYKCIQLWSVQYFRKINLPWNTSEEKLQPQVKYIYKQ